MKKKMEENKEIDEMHANCSICKLFPPYLGSLYVNTESGFISRGAEANVYRGTLYLNNKEIPVAVKEYFMQQLGQDMYSRPDGQENLEQIDHPYICKYYGFAKKSCRLYQVYELCDCDLKQYLEKNKNMLNYTIKCTLIAQLLNAMEYLTTRSICHRDIKPANILISKGDIKLADFGHSKTYFDSKKVQTHTRGTILY